MCLYMHKETLDRHSLIKATAYKGRGIWNTQGWYMNDTVQ